MFSISFQTVKELKIVKKHTFLCACECIVSTQAILVRIKRLTINFQAGLGTQAYYRLHGANAFKTMFLVSQVLNSVFFINRVRVL